MEKITPRFSRGRSLSLGNTPNITAVDFLSYKAFINNDYLSFHNEYESLIYHNNRSWYIQIKNLGYDITEIKPLYTGRGNKSNLTQLEIWKSIWNELNTLDTSYELSNSEIEEKIIEAVNNNNLDYLVKLGRKKRRQSILYFVESFPFLTYILAKKLIGMKLLLIAIDRMDYILGYKYTEEELMQISKFINDVKTRNILTEYYPNIRQFLSSKDILELPKQGGKHNHVIIDSKKYIVPKIGDIILINNKYCLVKNIDKHNNIIYILGLSVSSSREKIRENMVLSTEIIFSVKITSIETIL